MNDDFDFSHLLDETPPPARGPAQVRAIATKRRQRRQAAVGSLGAVAILGLGSALALGGNSNGQPDVFLSQEANSVYTTTTTEAPTTTTIPVDPHQEYVDVEFETDHNGVPLGTRLESTASFPEAKKGDRRIVVARDEHGAMVWVVEVLRPLAADYSREGRNRVLGVIDMADWESDQYLCTDQCAKDGKVDPTVVVVHDSDGRPSSAFKVDTKKFTTSSISPQGWGYFIPLENDAIVIPERPELYRVAAVARDEDEVAAYRSAGVHMAGSLAVDFRTKGELRWLYDSVEKKRIATYVTKEGKFADMVVVDENKVNQWTAGATNVPGGWSYKGGKDELLFSLVRWEGGKPVQVDAAWRVDIATNKIVPVDVKDLKYIPPAS